MNRFSFGIFLAVLATCHGSGVPTFSWLQKPLTVLHITYPNGLTDFAVLKSFNPIPAQSFERQEDIDSCIFDGYLTNEKDVYVTVTGCAHTDTFNVQFRSQHLDHHMFMVVDGNVEAVESVFGQKALNKDGEYETVRDVGLAAPLLPESMVKTTEERGLNPRGYIATVKIRYDENFKAKFGTESVNTIRRIVAQAQNIWKWPSLTTSVTFQIDPSVDAVAGRFVAGTDIDKAAVYSTANYNINLVMAFRNSQPGTVGIAYLGTVCYPPSYAKLRIALCEYFTNDLKSAEVVAHEIGHNMNMQHDFVDQPGATRRDSKGNSCTNIGGVMDYYGTVNKWSSCSIEDFTALANKSEFCLKSN